MALQLVRYRSHLPLQRPTDLAHQATLLVPNANRAAFFVTQMLITLRQVSFAVNGLREIYHTGLTGSVVLQGLLGTVNYFTICSFLQSKGKVDLTYPVR